MVEKGLFSDSSLVNQPKDTYRYALNAVFKNGALQNENSTTLIDSDRIVLGSGYFVSGEIVIFSIKDGVSEIGIIFNDTYTVILSEPSLNFSKPILAECRIKRGCDKIVYFIDGVNKDRALNLDRISDYYEGSVFQTNLLNINSEYDIINVDNVDVLDSGGELYYGTYFFTFQTIDKLGNSSDYLLTTRPIHIYQNSSSNPSRYVGAFNEDAYPTKGIPKATKSIRLQVSGINATKIRIVATVFYNSDALTNRSYIAVELDVYNNEIDYTYSGEVEEITTSPTQLRAKYDYSHTLYQLNDVLLRADFKEPTRDWANVQRWANTITTKYKTKTAPAKSEKYLYSEGSYCKDEIYALGIVLIYPEGNSPVFHIPGRIYDDYMNVTLGNSNSHYRNTNPTAFWDSQTLVVASTTTSTTVAELEVKHLGLSLGDTVPRWKVFNTAIDYGTDYGDLAYYQSNKRYPDIRDCTGTPIYPYSYVGSDIVMDYVRHHKMPDIPLVGNKELYLEFNIPTLPQDAIGYYLVRAQRTDANKTVWDTGLLSRAFITEPSTFGKEYLTHSSPFYSAGTYLGNPVQTAYYIEGNDFTNDQLEISIDASTNPYVVFKSPKFEVQDKFGGADYYNIVGGIEYAFNAVHNPTSYTPENYIGYWGQQTGLSQSILRRNLNVLDSRSCGFDTNDNTFEYTIAHINNMQKQIYSKIEGLMPDTGNTIYTGGTGVEMKFGTGLVFLANAKRLVDPYSVLPNIEYLKLHTNVYTTTGLVDVYGGDTFIGEFQDRRTVNRVRFDAGSVQTSQTGTSTWYRNSLLSYTTESDINFGSVFATDDIRFYPYNSTPREYLQPYQFSNGTWDDYTADFTENKYEYSLDYNVHSLQTFVSFNNWTDLCKDCYTKYENRISISEIDINEELEDSYRVFLSSNYKDIPAHAGRITNIFHKENTIYIQCLNSTFFIPINYQQLETENSLIQLNQPSALLAAPYTEIRTKTGYLGNQGRFNVLVTDYGILTVDQHNKRIYMISESPMAISDMGISQFCNFNLNSQLQTQYYNLTGEQLLFDNTTQGGPGLITTYDRENARFLITKKDYRWLDTSGIIPSAEVNGFRLEGELFTYDNEDYFEDLSWTISFSLTNKSWVSYHSFRPNFYFYTSDTFYSGDTNIWKHEILPQFGFNRIYDVRRPFLVEVVVPTLTSPIISNFSFITDSFVWDDTNKELTQVNSTFNFFHAYNEWQSTNKMFIAQKDDPYMSILWSSVYALISEANRIYRISQIRDLVTTKQFSIFTSTWNDNTYRSQKKLHGIDKVLNTSVIDVNKSLYTQSPFKGKYVAVRLSLENNDFLRLIFHVWQSLNQENQL